VGADGYGSVIATAIVAGGQFANECADNTCEGEDCGQEDDIEFIPVRDSAKIDERARAEDRCSGDRGEEAGHSCGEGRSNRWRDDY
jgi:hypothetical protein